MPTYGTAFLALPGLAHVLPQVKGTGGEDGASTSYLGGFDLVSTAAAPPRQVREHLTLLPEQAGLHLTPPLLQDDGGCGAGGRRVSKLWGHSTGHSRSMSDAYLPTYFGFDRHLSLLFPLPWAENIILRLRAGDYPNQLHHCITPKGVATKRRPAS